MADRRFPILIPGKWREDLPLRSVPWGMLQPHEEQAIANHSQSLEELARRGGLSPVEILLVLDGRSWRERRELREPTAYKDLIQRVEVMERDDG